MARTPPARTAGQRPLIGVVAAIVLVLGALTVADVPITGGSGGGAGGAPEPGRVAQDVGPVRGTEINAYIEDRTTALLEASDDVDTAVVSFTSTLTVQDAIALVGAVGDVRVVLYRLPLAAAPARSVRVGSDEDVAAAVGASLEDQVVLLREERASARELLDSDTVDDEAFVQEYERRIEEVEGAIAAAEQRKVVHAVVVRASLASLQGLIEADAVRLVDPAPAGTDVGTSVFTGLLPSDQDTTSQGRAA